jgi:16S rRNA (guanine966-N2)-methyltransferase
MTRIIAGAARGRRLTVPAAGTRPTTDRVRESLFAALGARLGAWTGRHVLDLYAGSGALGLEGLSRGAAHVLLVERDRRAATVARSNVAAVALPGAVVVVADVARLAAAPPAGPARPPYDVVLADPPYDVPAASVATVLAGLVEHGWLAPEAWVVVERGARDPASPWPDVLRADGERRYGETALWYGRRDAGRSAG